MPIFTRKYIFQGSIRYVSLPECILGCHQPLILNSRDIPQVWMPFYYDGLCADHLRTWEAAKRRTGGNRNPVLFFQQSQKRAPSTYHKWMEPNKRGGLRRRFQNLDVWLKKIIDIDTFFLFFCYLLFVFGNLSKSICCVF